MLSAPGEESTVIVAQGNSVSSDGYEILSPLDIILFNVACLRGRAHSHDAPGELSITNWP